MQSDLWPHMTFFSTNSAVQPPELEQTQTSSDDLLRPIKKIALTPQEIKSLLGNYPGAVNKTSPDVFQKKSGWDRNAVVRNAMHE